MDSLSGNVLYQISLMNNDAVAANNIKSQAANALQDMQNRIRELATVKRAALSEIYGKQPAIQSAIPQEVQDIAKKYNISIEQAMAMYQEYLKSKK
jgi:hypothetical protein